MSHDKTIDDYGVWLRAAINVKSREEESRLVFWVKRRFLHPITDVLAPLDRGFYRIPNPQVPSLKGLDYIRTPGLIFPSCGTLLEHDTPEPNNSMLSVMKPILRRAIEKHATVYLFGARFNTKDGMHEVHMNQGSLEKYANDVGKDGALIIKFKDHWEAVFLAFGSQKTPTDDTSGLALKNSLTLAEQLGYIPLTPEKAS
ncbi:hypothetical protein BGW42_003468 [Actinomortierella wolfii]|nr:hypothetical protein BGW42_003468 [Actinomortierella wolfii]